MKKKIACLMSALTILLTACSNGEIHENISELKSPDFFPEAEALTETAAFSADDKSDGSEETHTSEPSDLPLVTETKASEKQEGTETLEIVSDESKTFISLYDCAAEPYDNVVSAEYTVLDSETFPDYDPDSTGARFPSSDKEAEKAALQAYKNSDYYKEALAEAKKLFAYENGELVLPESNWITEGYVGHIDETAAPEVDLKAKVIDSEKAFFDGKNEESIFFISFAAPPRCIISSEDTAEFVVPVYVNSEGEAFILDSAGYQARICVSLVKYEKSGKIHINSGGAHSEGTARTAIFSFENGQPKEELNTYGAVFEMEENGRIFRWGRSYSYYSFIFYSDELSRYCGIKAVPVTESAAEAICSDEKILETIPDVREQYEKGQLMILGGKYVLVGGYNSFEYDGTGFAATYEGRYRYYIPVFAQNDDPPFEEKYIFNIPIDGAPPQ